MREIKFRAWHKDEQRMLSSKDLFELTASYFNNPFSRDDLEVLQYTGLKDKNGKEIYEGDILRICYEYGDVSNGNYLVTWKVSEWNLEPFFDMSLGRAYLKDDITIEVIGNIYENPELLKT